ncbi:MAG: DNA mismatch repair endonuclease MutL [Lachnospiraceae bacterium]
MSKIAVLDQATINQIAAGEVVERPSSVVKELVENAIDAGATSVTVEIKEGGIGFLRVTDNGSGMEKDDIPVAFLRHSTSKIRSAVDLLSIGSLGFRGEALSSIAAVAQVELLTKTKDAFVGSRYVIEGGEEKAFEEVGCPAGTTFLVRNLFYNTPARRKFLKTPMTEGGYISELMERMALSRPDISFKYMNNGKVVLHTTGSGELKDIIYHIYGRDTAMASVPAQYAKDTDGIEISGYIGKPVLARGNRGQENYFINGRYIRCSIIGRAIEDAYKSYMMGHKYPFTAMHISIPANLIDVNVHPSKMELRFANGEAVYHAVYETVRAALSGKSMIVPVSLSEQEEKKEQEEIRKQLEQTRVPEPFEQKRFEMERKTSEPCLKDYQPIFKNPPSVVRETAPVYRSSHEALPPAAKQEAFPSAAKPEEPVSVGKPEQLNFTADLLDKKQQKEFHLIGQVFATYWLIEMEQQLFIIDQHAAHEKVLFERTMEKIKNREEIVTQTLLPPLILSLSMREADCLNRNMEVFRRLGFVIEEFGGMEYKVTEVPADLVSVDSRELLMEVINTLMSEREFKDSDLLLEKVASLSCKAAVKGNHRMSEAEAKQLISDMLTLDNPYHCPHGRPTTISMSKYELERKFKRIVS